MDPVRQAHRMRLRLGGWLLTSLVLIGGCRGDGPMPTIDEETSNRLGDIARDLRSVANGEADARKDLSDDLRVFAVVDALWGVQRLL